jgi:N-acetylglucosamine-6-phosphate deacetylase
MNELIVEGGTVLFPGEGKTEEADITIEDGTIESIGPKDRSDEALRLDADGCYVSPGFIDLQVNGGMGVDFLTCDALGPGRAGEFWLSHGTTSFLGTVITNPPESMNEAMGALSRSNAPNLLGLHVEGPFLSRDKRGTHNGKHILEPDEGAFRDIVDGFNREVNMVTFAPELDGAEELLDWIKAIEAVPSIGHSNASYEKTLAFIDRGVNAFTHLFNGMKGFHHREPGTVGAGLNSNASVGLIADGLHLSPGAVKLVEKTKNSGEVYLVTDAIAAAGMSDGQYVLGDQDIYVEDGLAKLENGTIAGSTLTLEKAVKNYLEFTGASLLDAIKTVTTNPADLLGLKDEIGTLSPGTRADLVVLSNDLDVKYTLIEGEVVYESEN